MVGGLKQGDPRRIGPYRLIGRLGRGGMGHVYLGVSAGGRPVAVKVIRADLATDPEFFRPIVEGLSNIGLVRRDEDRPWARVVIEKPFGRDLASAMALDRDLSRFLRPDQRRPMSEVRDENGLVRLQIVFQYRIADRMFEIIESFAGHGRGFHDLTASRRFRKLRGGKAGGEIGLVDEDQHALFLAEFQ